MKKLKFSLLALSFIAGGVLISSAAAPQVGVNYPLNAQFTNNPPALVDIMTLPKLPSNAGLVTPGQFGVIATDGGGKITGVQNIMSTLGGGTNGFYVADISGSISSFGSAKATNGGAKVALTIKGNGYAAAGAGKGVDASPAVSSTMHLTFKGTTGITPNTQVINTSLAGYDIWLNADGTTNHVDRFDPWTNTVGNLESWSTVSFMVDSYTIDTVYTTNVIAGITNALLVTNFVNQSIESQALTGSEYSTNLDGGLNFLGNPTVKFGTPNKADRGDGFFGTNALGEFQFYNATYGSNVSIGRWIIATLDSVETIARTNNTTYTSNANILSTNFTLNVGDNEEDTTMPPNSTVIFIYTNADGSLQQGLLTNVVYSSTEYIVLTPIATNTIYSTNMYYQPADYSFVDNESTNNTQNPGLTVEFHNRVWSDVYSNDIVNQYFTRDDYRLAVALQSSVDTTLGNGTNIIIYTNTFVAYSSFVTNLTYTTNAYPTPADTNGIQYVEYEPGDININDNIYTNVVDYSTFVTYTNFAIITNSTTVYGADMADLPTALAAFYSQNTATNNYQHPGSLYDRDDNRPDFAGSYLWANQEDDFFSQKVVAQTITNQVQTPSITNFPVAVRMASNFWYTISGSVQGTITAAKLKLNFSNKAPAPALYEEAHNVWTAIPSATNEQSYVVTPYTGNLDVISAGSLDMAEAAVVQLSKKLWISSGMGKGIGTLDSKGGYKATANGIGQAKGASISLKGNVGPLITDYVVITNAPEVVSNVVNLAAPPGSFVLSVTNTTSGILFFNGIVPAQTNINGITVTYLRYSYPAIAVTNLVFQTNVANNAIKSILLNGKILGQTVPKDTAGWNLDAPYPSPLPEVVTPETPVIETNHFGWPLTRPEPFANGP